MATNAAGILVLAGAIAKAKRALASCAVAASRGPEAKGKRAAADAPHTGRFGLARGALIPRPCLHPGIATPPETVIIRFAQK